MILGIDLGTGPMKTSVVDDSGGTATFTEADYGVDAPKVAVPRRIRKKDGKP